MSIVAKTPLCLRSAIKDPSQFWINALIVQDLDLDIFTGLPFMASNDNPVHPHKHKFFIVGTHIMPYGCSQTLHTCHAVKDCSGSWVISFKDNQIAEDLNCGGNSPQEVFANWQKVRSALGWCIVHCLSCLHCFLQLEWSKDVLHHISWRFCCLVNPKDCLLLVVNLRIQSHGLITS